MKRFLMIHGIAGLVAALLATAAGAQPADPGIVEWRKVLDGEIRAVAHDSSGGMLALGERRLHRSTDGGRKWSGGRKAPNGTMTVTVDGAILISGISDVYRSTNRGRSWSLLRPPKYFESPQRPMQYDRPTVGPKPPRPPGYHPPYDRSTIIIYPVVAVTSRGTIIDHDIMRNNRSTDGGKTWLSFRLDERSSYLDRIVESPDGTFYGTQPLPNVLWTSTDDGATWEARDTLMRVAQPSRCHHSLAVGRSGVIFFSSDSTGLVRSADGGRSWQRIDVEPGQDTPCPPYQIEPLPNRAVLAMHGPGSPFISFDDGTTWRRLAVPAGFTIHAITSAPDGTLFAATREGLFRTTTPVR